MTKRELLHVKKNKKFDEICALIARELGYGELGTMSAAMRGHVEREAEYHVKQWEETVEMRTKPTLRPFTPCDSRYRYLSLDSAAPPKPAYCRMVQSRPRYIVG
jgi:hypothetical protein